ncbi:MAG: OmpA family protein [Fibrobacteres bacterium]|nr:OmpA family protein [Fibrobacterota bacterium]
MTEIKATPAQLAKGIKVPIGLPAVIKVVRSRSRVRLYGMFFDLNKSFLLPSAMEGIRGVKSQYDAHPGSNLLIIGHTDTSGQDAYNLTLSLERADAMAAYLTDKREAWEAFFGEAKPEEKRWGTREIQLMLSVLPEGGNPFFTGEAAGANDGETQAAVKAFQQAKGLKVDGIAGPATRKALIADYMAMDGTTLPPDLTPTTHGCGENFPAVETEDGKRSPDDRRVEILFFDGDIVPAPPGKTSKKGSTQYPAWLAGVSETLDFDAGGGALAPRSLHISVIAVTENNLTPLADTPYKLRLNDGKTFSKVTDANGLVEQDEVRPGDHELEIAGGKTRVPGIPKDLANLKWVVLGAAEPEK